MNTWLRARPIGCISNELPLKIPFFFLSPTNNGSATDLITALKFALKTRIREIERTQIIYRFFFLTPQILKIDYFNLVCSRICSILFVFLYKKKKTSKKTLEKQTMLLVQLFYFKLCLKAIHISQRPFIYLFLNKKIYRLMGMALTLIKS